MTTIINGSSPSITFSDSTTQSSGVNTVNPVFTGDASISGLTVGKGGGAVATATVVGNGASAGFSNTTAIGYQALSLGGGGGETAVGYRALYSETSAGGGNSAFGNQAGYSINGGGGNSAYGNTSLFSTTTGNNNAAYGQDSLRTNTTGSSNVACGNDALRSNTTASDNTAVGFNALYSNTTGTAVTTLGYKAGYASNGSVSVYVGFNCGVNATGSSNTFIGSGSGESITTGGKNSILGRYNGNQGGLDIRTLSNYIVLSDGDGNPRGIFDNNGDLLLGTTTNGYSAKQLNAFNGTSRNGIVLNETANSSNTVYAAFLNALSEIGSIRRVGATSAVVYNTTSDQRLKSNITDANPVLDKLMDVKVRQFDWTEGNLHQDAGFIAQELAPVLSGIVTQGKKEEDMWQMDYARLTPYLVKAIQELNAKLEAQAVEIAQLKGN